MFNFCFVEHAINFCQMGTKLLRCYHHWCMGVAKTNQQIISIAIIICERTCYINQKKKKSSQEYSPVVVNDFYYMLSIQTCFHCAFSGKDFLLVKLFCLGWNWLTFDFMCSMD